MRRTDTTFRSQPQAEEKFKSSSTGLINAECFLIRKPVIIFTVIISETPKPGPKRKLADRAKRKIVIEPKEGSRKNGLSISKGLEITKYSGWRYTQMFYTKKLLILSNSSSEIEGKLNEIHVVFNQKLKDRSLMENIISKTKIKVNHFQLHDMCDDL